MGILCVILWLAGDADVLELDFDESAAHSGSQRLSQHDVWHHPYVRQLVRLPCVHLQFPTDRGSSHYDENRRELHD